MTRADLSWIYGALLAFIAILLAFVWISGSGGELLEPIRRADETERSPAPTEDPERALPDAYQSADDFAAERRHEFPALHEAPTPAPVGGTGRLTEVYDYWPAGTDVASALLDVVALRIERSPGPELRAYLNVPVDPELLEHLQSLSRGQRVTVAGIGHGDGRRIIYVYPVHWINGREP